MSDLHKLSKPFPSKYVHTNPSGGGSYVKHHVVNQRLLMDIGPFDFALVEILRGRVEGRPPNPNGNSARAKAGTPALDNAVVGAVCRLTISIDQQPVTIEEVGDCEEPHNWPHDGARMKDAMSDAFKRCAMRIGLGLHLWSQDEFFLDVALGRAESASSGGGSEGANGAPAAAKEPAGSATASREPAPTSPPPGVDPTTGEIKTATPPVPASGAERSGTGAAPPTSGAAPTNPPPDPMTGKQRALLFGMLTDRGLSSDEDRHDFATEVLGRPVSTFVGLSKADCSKLIDYLNGLTKAAAQ